MTLPLATRTNAAVLFLDLQNEIVKNSHTVPLDRLRQRASVLARLAALHTLPTFASSVPPGGEYLHEVLDPLPALTPRPRTQTTAFADEGLIEQLRASGRTILLLSGVASEIVVQRTALDALEAGSTCTLRWMPAAESIREPKMPRGAGSCKRAASRPRAPRSPPK